jgi:hypothetical protein
MAGYSWRYNFDSPHTPHNAPFSRGVVWFFLSRNAVYSYLLVFFGVLNDVAVFKKNLL